jgi:acetyl/propionyl-CoA carboxylase alpha subunit
MGEAAVRAARAVGYWNAGTVEFLLDRDGSFYFLEMNTRLQVEHPVTEQVTGLDLVRAQLLVAQGEPLPAAFHDVEPRGHAIEVRLYAEDPYRNFAPSPGRIELLRWPLGPGVRVDAGVYEGAEVPIHYDPMLAKLIVWGADRSQALDRLRRALGELRVEGVATGIPLFQALLEDAEFLAADFDIAWLDRKLKDGGLALPVPAADRDLPFVAAALAQLERDRRAAAAATPQGGPRSRWATAARNEALRRASWS